MFKPYRYPARAPRQDDFTHVTLRFHKPAKVQFSKLGNGQVYVNCEPLQGRDLVCFRAASKTELRKDIEARYPDAVFSNFEAPDARAEELKNLATLREQAHVPTSQEKLEARNRLERNANKLPANPTDDDVRKLAASLGIRPSVLDALNREGEAVLEQVTLDEMNRLAGNMTNDQRRRKIGDVLESLEELPHWKSFSDKYPHFMMYGRTKDSMENLAIFVEACKTMGWLIPTKENADILLRNLVENSCLFMSNGFTRAQTEILGHGKVRPFRGIVSKAARIPEADVNEAVRRLKQQFQIPIRPDLDKLKAIGCTNPEAMLEALELRFGSNNAAAEAQDVHTKTAAELHKDINQARIDRDKNLSTAERMRRAKLTY